MDFTDRDIVSEDKLIHFLKNQVIGRPKRVRNTDQAVGYGTIESYATAIKSLYWVSRVKLFI